MGREAQLCRLLSELVSHASESFTETMQEQARSLLQSVAAPSLDLKPPLSLRETMSTLREIMMVYQQALLEEEDRTEDFNEVLDNSLGPASSLIDAMKSKSSDAFIFEANCLVYIQVCAVSTL